MIGRRLLGTAATIVPTIAILIMLGCGSVPKVRYYTLGDVASAARAGGDTTRPLLRVERLSVAQPYDGRRIVYRPAPNEVAFWDFRQWAGPPSKMITSRVAELLDRSGLFEDIDTFPYSWKDADLVLKGAVLAFEEVDRENEWYGRIKLFLELRSRETGRTLWSSKIEVEKKASGRNPEALVLALSEALDEAVARVERGMAEALQ